MKKTVLAAVLLSLSAPQAFAHGNHDEEGEGAVVKLQSVRKAGSAPAVDKTRAASPDAGKPEQPATSAPAAK
ncbi:MAG TPA: hypothetical protein VLI06_02870 [Solimonas sp.]|nr:hypothetical protein [Solimonas sp.]